MRVHHESKTNGLTNVPASTWGGEESGARTVRDKEMVASLLSGSSTRRRVRTHLSSLDRERGDAFGRVSGQVRTRSDAASFKYQETRSYRREIRKEPRTSYNRFSFVVSSTTPNFIPYTTSDWRIRKQCDGLMRSKRVRRI
jgi:hypothetical protein